MDGKKRLARDIAERLEFYRDIGVEWSARGSAPRRTEKRREEQPQPALPKPAGRFFPQTESMFDRVSTVAETLSTIRSDLGECTRCKLAPLRKNIVFGSGNPHAALMFVGEAPGADEDEQGLPFVGRAGQLLTKIIEAIDMKREDVYICNILKCRPPGNRNPEPDEIASCQPFLFRQIQSVRPKVICALGT